MKIKIKDVFVLLCEFKTYPEIDMRATLKYGVDFLHIFKKAAKTLGFEINEFGIELDNNILTKMLDHMCSQYCLDNTHSIQPDIDPIYYPLELEFEI